MTRLLIIDSLSPVSEKILNEAAAGMGQMPSAWGRYFTSVSTKGTGEYHHATENPTLAAHGIRVLPIARQTNHVGGARSLGFADGLANAQDLIATFGADYLQSTGARFRMFLDVEGNGLSRMSAEYYLGWDDGLKHDSGDVEIVPCVYGIPGDGITWGALRSAIARGARCGGVWLSHPYVERYVEHNEPIQWSPQMLRPFVAIEGVPLLLWQYGFCGTHDRNIVNPNEADASDFLRTLPLPQ